MNFLDFKEKMFELACFSTSQVYAWQPGFDRNNLTRWKKKGYIISLRQGYYTFPEYKKNPDYSLYFANKIYAPSYVSLHTALSFYGLIPEAIVQLTSVSTLKTASFKNDFGEYSYKSIKETLMFGYDLKSMDGGRVIRFAQPEKALLDLLYLYPFYNSEQELEELRLDEDYLQEELNKVLLIEYCRQFGNTALEKTLQLLIKIYSL